MPLNIAIVGGGVGGPSAAISLARNGHKVTIYERAENCLEGVGFAFRITPNSNRCLKFLGIDTKDGGAVEANTARLMNYDGTIELEVRENQDPEKAKKAASVFAYRPSLQQQLLDATVASGAKIKTGVKVTSVHVDKTELTFEDGSKVSANLILAADGVHSCIRPHIVDGTIFYPKVSTGHGCLRFTIPKKTIIEDPIASRIVNPSFRMFAWKSADKQIIVYPVDFDTQYNFNCTHPAELSSAETSGDDQGTADAIAYNQQISLDTVRSIYADFDPIAIRLLELADPTGFRVWKLMDMEEIPRWSVNHTVLLGDAAHPVVPFGFSGASMAIEDAVTLAALLPSHVGVEEVRERLELYECIRKPRVARVRETSRVFARGMHEPVFMAAYREWLGSHDAVEFAKNRLVEYLKGQNKEKGCCKALNGPYA